MALVISPHHPPRRSSDRLEKEEERQAPPPLPQLLREAGKEMVCKDEAETQGGRNRRLVTMY